MTQATVTEAAGQVLSEPLKWEISVPLLNNRIVAGTMVKVWVLSVAIFGLLLTLLFAIKGAWEVIPTVWIGGAVIGIGLILMSFLVMAVVFGNHMDFQYTVNEEGIRFDTIDKRVKGVNRVAIVAGALLGRPQAVGAGMIARSQESQEVTWKGNFRAEYRPASNLVILSNRWRRLMYVYCKPENYGVVADRIRSAMAVHGSEKRATGKSPLPRYLGYSALTVIATIPIFGLVSEFHVPLWLPLAILCFGLAMVWLVSLFGYVVISGIVLVIGAVLLDMITERESYLHPGTFYSHLSVLSGDDWALLFVAGTGMAVLVWMSILALRGRMRSMFEKDVDDMGG